VRAELAAIGIRPRAAARSGAESLTPSERRVAELAARGQTKREIAQILFVTGKTSRRICRARSAWSRDFFTVVARP